MLFDRISDPTFDYEKECQIMLYKIGMLDVIKGVELLECKLPKQIIMYSLLWREGDENSYWMVETEN